MIIQSSTAGSCHYVPKYVRTTQHHHFFTIVKMFPSLDKLFFNCAGKNASSFYLELTFILGPSVCHQSV